MSVRLGRADPTNELLTVLNVLDHCYVRESQHVLHYRQHVERIHHPKVREELSRIAAQEQKHVEALGAAITRLGAKVPDVVPVHTAKEQNCWLYLRTDLEEEERCGGELRDDLLVMADKFPEVACLLHKIDEDCKRHYAQLRAMLADSDPLSPGPP